SFRDGVWLVELAALADPALVPQIVASVVSAREVPGRPVVATVVEHLRARQVLLILDNCEHLAEACAALVLSLVRTCPQVTVLATSREPLGVSGEVAWSIPSLAIPDGWRSAVDDCTQLPELMEYEAVRLFVDRAQLVAPDFSVTSQNAAPLIRVCQRLDG